MLNETFAHLWTLGNNSYTRTGSPTIIYLLKVSSVSTRKNGKICSKLPLKTLKQRSTISNVDVEHISHLLLLFLMLTLSKQMFAGTHPINLKTLKLFWQSLTDVQMSQWNNYSTLVIPKKHCFVYTVFNHREQSFPEHSVSLFHENRCGNPLRNVYRIYYRMQIY